MSYLDDPKIPYSYPLPLGTTQLTGLNNTPNTNTPAGSGVIVDGTTYFQIVDGNYANPLSLPPVTATSKPITIARFSSFGASISIANTDLLAPLNLGSNECARFVPTSTGWRWIDSQVNSQAVSSQADFFRKAAGVAFPDGINDYTVPITHNGFLGLGMAADPISPLEFGDPLRNDVIRLWDGGITNDHQFYGFGINGNTLRYQVDKLNSSHMFAGAVSATASKQLVKILDRLIQVGDPLASAGEGYIDMGTLGVGDNAYLRFMSPASAPGNRIQAEISFDGSSGTAGISGSSISFKTADAVAGSTLKNRMHISAAGDVVISDPTVPYPETLAGNALLTVNGSIRVKGGPMLPTGGRQPGGLTFGTNNTSTIDFGSDTDGGITSLADGNLTFYSNGAIAGAVNPGGVWSKPGGGAWAATSDNRVKKNITRTTGTLAKLLQLSPIKFQYNGLAGTPDGGAYYEGLIAQEVQKIFPDWVTETREKIDGTPVLQVDTSPLVYALLDAVRELKGEIDKLKGVAVAAPVAAPVVPTTITTPLSVNMAKVDRLLKMDAAGLSAIGFTATQSSMFTSGSTALRAGIASGLPEAEVLKVLSALLTSIGLTLAGVMAKL